MTRSEERERRRPLRWVAVLLVVAGAVWLVWMPHGDPSRWDTLASYGVGAGLIATGGLLWFRRRIGTVRTALAALLLWSLIGNAVQWARSEAMSDAIRVLERDAVGEPRETLEDLEADGAGMR